MDDSKRRAFIKQQVAARKKLEDNPSTKRKPSEKVDRPPKKPKVGSGSTVGETPTISKLPLNLI